MNSDVYIYSDIHIYMNHVLNTCIWIILYSDEFLYVRYIHVIFSHMLK